MALSAWNGKDRKITWKSNMLSIPTGTFLLVYDKVFYHGGSGRGGGCFREDLQWLIKRKTQ